MSEREPTRADLIRAYTAAILRARREYAEHPFAASPCTTGHRCAWRAQKAALRRLHGSGGTRGHREDVRRSTGRKWGDS